MKFREGEIPYVYIYIYSKLKNKLGVNKYVRPKQVIGFLKLHLPRVPRVMHYPIMCQMEEYGLIKRINQQNYEVLQSNCDKILEELRNFTFW